MQKDKIKTKRKLAEITRCEVKEASLRVKSLNQLVKVLGLPNYRNFNLIQKRIVQWDIDISHWDYKDWLENKKNWDWDNLHFRKEDKDKFLLLKGNKCEECGISSWQGKVLTLEIHHVDGNRTNNNFENLQLLCPNCHALTDNWKL